MKKIFVLTGVLFAFSVVSVNAQKTTTRKATDLSFGVRAGLNLSNVVKDNDKNFSTEIKPGINAAVYVEIPVVSSFSVQPELQFSQKGYKASGSGFGSPYEYTQTSNFIEIPLLAKFIPSKSFAIVVGPQFSFLTSTKTKFTTNNVSYQNTVNQENGNLKKNLVGGVLGIEASAQNLIFSARYSLDFQSNNGDGTSTTPRYKNQVFGFSVGIKL